MRKILLVLISILVCPALAQAAKYGEDSPYAIIPVNSKLVLKQTITFEPDQISIKLRRVGDFPKAVNPYQKSTVCEFDLYNRLPEARVIEPTEFRIIKVVKDVEYVSAGNIETASLFGYSTSGPAWEIHSVIMYLKSEAYPYVYSMTCSYQDNIGEGDPLSITLIRWAVGRVFELELAPD
jgi:hypothetical protein